jgi:plastocyanin
MRRVLTACLVLGLVAGPALHAAAGSTNEVAIVGIAAGFDPGNLTIGLGEQVRWTNTDSIGHTSTQSAGVGLWNSGTLGAGDTFSMTLTAAGTYPYHCNIHSVMTGRVRVPVQASVQSNGKIKVVVASQAAQDGFVFDVQRRDGNGVWQLWKDGITKRTARFSPTADGEYAFRARLRRESGGSSKWSPAASVAV